MKKLKKVFTLLFVVVLVTIFLYAAISTVSVDLNATYPDPNMRDEGAKDPHAHIGEKTLCYNQEDWACGAQ
jgi:hypothetical protein